MYFYCTARSLKLRKKNTQTLKVDKLASTAATPDVTIARRVTWAPNISSTALSFPPVSRNNLSRPQSLPIPVSSSKPSISALLGSWLSFFIHKNPFTLEPSKNGLIGTLNVK